MTVRPEMTSSANVTTRFAVLALLAAAGCGGSSGGPSSPSSPTPTPTIPISAACGALGSAVSGSTAIVNGAECSVANSSVVLLNMKDSDGLQAGSCPGTVIA